MRAAASYRRARAAVLAGALAYLLAIEGVSYLVGVPATAAGVPPAGAPQIRSASQAACRYWWRSSPATWSLKGYSTISLSAPR